MSNTIECSPFGLTKDGEAVELYKLRNKNEVEVSIITFGGIITSFVVPDKMDGHTDIVLGYDTLQEYESCQISMGCIAGRFANRIADARFTLDGEDYVLEANSNGHHLHGGSHGFNKVVWQARIESAASSDSGSDEDIDSPPRLVLSYLSADGEGGYPGALSTQVAYSLTDDNELTIRYQATTDKPTVVNLTSHGYFNLRGHQHAGSNGIFEHQLVLAAEQYIPTSNEGIPLPKLCKVDGSPMDFRESSGIGDNISRPHQQLLAGSGFDHTWVLANKTTASDTRVQQPAFAARVYDPQSERTMEVYTTQPGVQFYTANHVSDCPGKSGAVYQRHGALCLETQHFPDSPNRPDFPSTVLRPGEQFVETTVYRIFQ